METPGFPIFPTYFQKVIQVQQLLSAYGLLHAILTVQTLSSCSIRYNNFPQSSPGFSYLQSVNHNRDGPRVGLSTSAATSYSGLFRRSILINNSNPLSIVLAPYPKYLRWATPLQMLESSWCWCCTVIAANCCTVPCYSGTLKLTCSESHPSL